MGPFEMVVAIVAIVMFAGVFKARKSQAERSGASDLELQTLKDEMARMERRLQTLEKLATDPSARLAAEIDRLRDRDGAIKS